MEFQELLSVAAKPASRVNDEAGACVEACYHCAAACELCAETCLTRTDLHRLLRCIRTDLNCVEACLTTARVLMRRGDGIDDMAEDQVRACEAICRSCAELCETHADCHPHCLLCAEACRRCEQACRVVLN